MDTNLLACKNPKWFTVKATKVDENFNLILDEAGNEILEDLLDDEGNPIKLITVECQWSHLGDTSQPFEPFIANPNDPEDHGRKLYQDLIDGKHGEIEDE